VQLPIIDARGLVKVYRTPKRRRGSFGALRTLFTREYSETRAVDGISFSIEAGELIGYIGPNGAGKSTTIKILTGIIEPTAGEVHVVGLIPWQRRQDNARNIGVVFGSRSQLWWDLPLEESFDLVRRMYRIEPDRYRHNLGRLGELLDIGGFIDQPVRSLSLGQRMRGELTAALLHDPPVVFLDEPTIGLDVVAKERIRSFIADMNRERRTTILLTTHDLADVERLCSRILLIDEGCLLFDGTVDQFKSTHAPYRDLVVRLEGGSDPVSLVGLPNIAVVSTEADVVTLRFDPAVLPVPEAVSSVAARCPLIDLSIVEPDLESIVRQFYERQAMP
jgi:ABC-2 type transport system ATP-binding protein